MEINDPNSNGGRAEAWWTAIRGTTDIVAMSCAADGRHDWAIAMKLCTLWTDVVVTHWRHRR